MGEQEAKGSLELCMLLIGTLYQRSFTLNSLSATLCLPPIFEHPAPNGVDLTSRVCASAFHLLVLIRCDAPKKWHHRLQQGITRLQRWKNGSFQLTISVSRCNTTMVFGGVAA